MQTNPSTFDLLRTAMLRFALGLLVLSMSPMCCFAESVTQGFLGEGQPWQTPYYVRDTGVEGPTVVVTGGVHGNEPAGSRAAEQIRHWPITRGKLIVVPSVNRFGLQENLRYIPKAAEETKDLNRNFPSPGIATGPRGEIAVALWNFVVAADPDWLFDLHEGYEFNISHKPKPGKTKSVGSTIIYDATQQHSALVERMLLAANSTVSDADRRFVPRGRGPKKTSLASAVIDVLNKKAMILETTFKRQTLPVRTRQHRRMMNVALREISMTEQDCSDIMTPPKSKRKDGIFVALYHDEGGSDRGVTNLTRVFDAASDLSVAHLDAKDIRSELLTQFDVVVFGGGSGSTQARTLEEQGAKSVQAFVRDGGGYVGVCGGAFLCSAHYPWSLKLIDTHVFTGNRDIPGVGVKSMYYRGETTTAKMQLTEEGRRIFPGISEHTEVQFHNGPIVSPKHLNGLTAYTPLAHFRSEQVLYPPQKGTMINTPAIAGGEFGKGRVISISPHPEATKGLEDMLAMAVRAANGADTAQQSSTESNTAAKPEKAKNTP